ncbi:MAG: hypothetical protein WA783_04490 [Phormidesmis sp.]
MSIELLIALIGLATAMIGLIAALTPYLGGLSTFVQKTLKKISPPDPPPSLRQDWFVNVGEHRGHLKWEDCVRYGCISAGGGLRFAEALQRLRLGDTVYAYITEYGYVGCGKVSKVAVPVDRFTTEPNNTPLLKRDLVTKEVNNQPDNPSMTEWVAGIEWFKTFERQQASKETKHYRPTVCRIRDLGRLASLRRTFGVKASYKVTL